jgi:ribosomal protein S18 acetylase RimI-like enzyme
LGPHADVRYELNELEWWSNWAGVTWISPKAYVMRSEEFSEPFFNRAGFIEMEVGRWAETVREMESIFDSHGLLPYIYVQETQDFSVLREALGKNYAVVDKVSVMEMRSPSFQSNPDVLVERAREEDSREWCEAYLQSFYGSLELIEPTLEIVQRSMGKEGVSFVMARIGMSVAGTLVMYRKQDVLGVYCVGTVPRFRRKGVANTMLEFAQNVSRDAGATMILQTMLSDGAEGLYIKMGLVSVYRKEIFARKEHPHS